jgi:hypothetical protein
MSWKNSRQFAVFFLRPRAGAVLNVVKSATGQSIAVYGVGGSALSGYGGADCRLRSDDRCRSAPSRLVTPANPKRWPAELTATRLSELDLPLDWTEQADYSQVSR